MGIRLLIIRLHNRNWPLAELEAVVEHEVRRLLFSPDYLHSLAARHAAEAVKTAPLPEADVLRGEISGIDRKIGRLMDLYQDGAIPADMLSARINKLHQEKHALAERLGALEPERPKLDFDADGVAAIVADFGLVWDAAEQGERRRIMQALINRIVLDGDDVSIEWAFLEN